MIFNHFNYFGLRVTSVRALNFKYNTSKCIKYLLTPKLLMQSKLVCNFLKKLFTFITVHFQYIFFLTSVIFVAIHK